ncbi:MAG: glycosyltransferase family 4 protein [Ignavibacteriae bacterium]|nr:glycosyltransferase family 4 protein [Ignavibacteriota bacterium]
MKILHIAAMPNYLIGVVNQMELEQIAARKLDLDHDVIIFCPDFVEDTRTILRKIKIPKSKLFAYIYFRVVFYHWVITISSEYDYLLLRYSGANIFQALSSLFWKNIITVHHTKEGEEFNDRSFFGYICVFLEFINAKLSLNHVPAIISVTKEIADYQLSRAKNNLQKVPRLIYPNGYLHQKDDSIKLNLDTSKYNIIFVAERFISWHGLDLLVKSVISQPDLIHFTIHLVGSIPEDIKKTLSFDERFVIHGMKKRKHIVSLYNSCDLGLSSFALYRKNMKSACTLKVREYLAHGLPVYCNYHDSGFPDNFPYIKQNKADIKIILDYCKKSRSFNRQNIINESLMYMSKTILLKKLHQELFLQKKSIKNDK